MTTTAEEARAVTVEQAAQMLGVSRGTAYALARAGDLPGAIRLGGRIVVSRRKLLEAIDGPLPESQEA